MVVFTNGLADKAQYRKFKLTAKGNDDYGQLRETIQRRLKHLKDWGQPDLVVIDGGKGQLGAVADLLEPAGITVVGRNKSGQHSGSASVKLVRLQADHYQEIPLEAKNNIAKLIARLDSEAHRFAISYHTSLKRSRQTSNWLEQIPGIGPASRRQLLRHFGSLSAIQKADLSEIAEQIGPSKAKKIKSHLDPAYPNRV
jgi:excinuclease ABC subunit C